MPRQIALLIFVSFIVWLFFRDRKLRPMTSVALWIPLFWVIIIGTRAVSMWFSGEGLEVATLDDYLKGSPFDRNIDIGLLVAGLAILIKRRTILSDIFSENRLFFMFFIFCGISCLWSDYAFTSLKRYIKDISNIVMALIIITETKPEQALKAVLARYAYIAVVLSVLFIIYFPEYGRYYGRWNFQVVYCGITTNKNQLGQVAFICGVFLVWDFITTLSKDESVLDKLDLFIRGILLSMLIWLFYMAHSSTSNVCMILGTFILLVLRSSFGKKHIKNLGIWTLCFTCFFITIYTIPGLMELFTDILGRDTSLTGRTDLWQELLAQPINPLLGAGYQSFWQTPAAAQIGEKFYFIPNQAHNGYLEVYIQTGLISLLLLIGAIITAGNKLKKGLLTGSTSATLLFPFFIIILINNWTEATINKMSILWFVLILSLLYGSRMWMSSPNLKDDKVELPPLNR
jgi:exopolysaccharide production protein ExoQ